MLRLQTFAKRPNQPGQSVHLPLGIEQPMAANHDWANRLDFF